MDVEAHIAQLEAHGYAIMEGALDLAFCDEIIAEIDRLERDGEPSLKGNAFVGYKTVRYFDLLNRGEVWQRVAAHPKLLPVLRGALGPDMLLSTMGTAVIGAGERAQPIHRDDELYAMAMPHRNLVCNTMWALTDFTDENGATRIVPDTHRLAQSADPKGAYESIPAAMPKGSVCFVLGTCYHGGGANRSDQRRWALTINYCAGAMRQQENLMLATTRERAAGFSKELQGLIGYDATLRGVGHVDAGPPRRLLAPYLERADTGHAPN
ncbi:MAG TPA: phytanoyl-CoA dioxygenase family protein [Caulobacteraceae bacterium]|jgi:ectoine hydroxylase-related dioxygenase (phytanoyl-CoA dioxygenase family)|nr:phytanoyl-CoA dioxygenase family protein [Caulobacteraceae bacterium]